MRALRSILPLGFVLAGSLSAIAAPVVDGAPRWSTSGPGLAGLGSSTIFQADLDSAEQDTPLAGVLRDGLAPAVLSLVTVAAEVPGVTSRKASFDPSGWTETLDVDAGSTLSARVFTFAPNVFAYRLTLDGAVPLPLTVRSNGPELPRLATPGSTSTVTSVDSEQSATFAVGARFGEEAIHNVSNIVNIEHGKGSLHSRISGLYLSINEDITGSGVKTVRQWLSGQSFEAQAEFGRKVIENISSGKW